MSKAVVSRPLFGITLNGEKEYVLNSKGEVQIFDSVEDAERFLWEHGMSDEEREFVDISESVGVCKRCGSQIFPSPVDGYTFQCFTCDEDFYEFEQR